MAYRLRQITEPCRWSEQLTFAALDRIIPLTTIQSVLTDTGIQLQRQRKLTFVVLVWLLIAMNLYTDCAIAQVLVKLVRGLRFIWPTTELQLPTPAAITQRRYQLGVRPLASLFHRVCRPLATPQTPGAFQFGLRLVAIDGTTEPTPDTPANARAFGYHFTEHGPGPFPLVQALYLVECGTHAIIDAGFWPSQHSERAGCLRLLRSLQRGMLLLWDRGFHDAELIARVQQRGAHLLGRLPAHVKPRWVRALPDGSYLARLLATTRNRQRRTSTVLVRIITYRVTDPARADPTRTYRVVTTLRSPTQAPALELVCTYHERWEIELVIDEIDTHQRLAGRPLRSLKPSGVLQELYALLLAHYVVRALMYQAAQHHGCDTDRLSFVQCIEVLKDAIPELQMVVPEQLPQRYQQLLRDMASARLPARRNRTNPRVVKRQQSGFALKRAEHSGWPQPSGSFGAAIRLLPDSQVYHAHVARVLHPSKSSVWSRLPEPLPHNRSAPAEAGEVPELGMAGKRASEVDNAAAKVMCLKRSRAGRGEATKHTSGTAAWQRGAAPRRSR